ncbi:uncharacterized protein YneF (UPF0154 family) [Bacillus sp. 3255]|nr:uncharacterized protein YneF (UPF0154 family) [Bacillus sp. 3255]
MIWFIIILVAVVLLFGITWGCLFIDLSDFFNWFD